MTTPLVASAPAPAAYRILPKVRKPYPFLVEMLVKRHHLARVVEVGVGAGHVMRALLWRTPWVEYAGVDTWTGPEGTAEGRLAIACEAKARGLERAYDGRATLRQDDLLAAAARIDDGAADLVLLSAVPPADLEAMVRTWLPKVAEGGWLGGYVDGRRITAGMLAELLPGHMRRDRLWSIAGTAALEALTSQPVPEPEPRPGRARRAA